METRASELTPSFSALSRSLPATRWERCELKKPAAQQPRCGAKPPILLGFPDGKLGDYISDRTLVYRLTDRLAGEIQRLHPDALITWGPDGGTGHPDHRLVSALVTQLVRAGAPGATERLFYMYIPAEGMAAMQSAAWRADRCSFPRRNI